MRGPRLCRDRLGFQWTGRLSEQLDHPFKTPIGQRLPLLHPLLEQPLIGWTLRHGVLDQRFAPIAAPLAVQRKVVKHQGEQIIFMRAGELGEYTLKTSSTTELHGQIERHKRLTPVIGDEHVFNSFA